MSGRIQNIIRIAILTPIALGILYWFINAWVIAIRSGMEPGFMDDHFWETFPVVLTIIATCLAIGSYILPKLVWFLFWLFSFKNVE